MSMQQLFRLPAQANRTRMAATRFVSSSLPLSSPSDEEKDILHQASNLGQLRLNHSAEPIPYTGGIELTPENAFIDKLGHKKVSVVGCGQVGMAIAYSMLNQVTAGTIALVDMNKDKLEGEAKDLEQGSAFHQHVRILASDEYVSMRDPASSHVTSNFTCVSDQQLLVYCATGSFPGFAFGYCDGRGSTKGGRVSPGSIGAERWHNEKHHSEGAYVLTQCRRLYRGKSCRYHDRCGRQDCGTQRTAGTYLRLWNLPRLVTPAVVDFQKA